MGHQWSKISETLCCDSILDGIGTVNWINASLPPEVDSFLMFGVMSLVLVLGTDFYPLVCLVVIFLSEVIISRDFI